MKINGIFNRMQGIRLPHKKFTADIAPIRLPIPKTVTIPMSMHIGKEAQVVIQKGDNVKVGQLIGQHPCKRFGRSAADR